MEKQNLANNYSNNSKNDNNSSDNSPLKGNSIMLILFLPLLYFVILSLSHLFNTYSSTTWIETFVITGISAIIAIIYYQIIKIVAKLICKNKENTEEEEKSSIAITRTLFFSGNIFIVSVFFSLFVTFIINFFLGVLVFVVISLILFVLFITNINKTLSNQIFKIGFFKKLTSMVLLIILCFFNPLILLSYIPLRSEFIDVKLVEKRDMRPTLNTRNVIVVDKISGLLRKPSYNDLVLLSSPLKEKSERKLFKHLLKGLKDSELSYIRRVIAKQGDTIDLNSNSGYVLNNKEIKEDYLKEPDNGLICQLADHCGETTISKNSYFLLGDNRNACQDSRIWSEVNKEFLRGKIFSVIWPKSAFKVF